MLLQLQHTSQVVSVVEVESVCFVFDCADDFVVFDAIVDVVDADADDDSVVVVVVDDSADDEVDNDGDDDTSSDE